MSSLVLERIFYPVVTLGYGKRIGIWVRGCRRNCPGCISPELQSYEGDAIEVRKVIEMLPEGCKVDGLTISGGEPFDQAEGLAELVLWFTEHISKDVVIFTGYTEEELKNRSDRATRFLLEHISVLIDGPYIEELNDGIGLRGSSNQRVIVYRFPERYNNSARQDRQVQFAAREDSLLQIGIPPLPNLE